MNSVVVKNNYSDSTIWNALSHRQTDIVIASCYKAGTTLTQQIVNILINGNTNYKESQNLHELSPWVENMPDPLFDSLETKLKHIENLPDRRFFKSHLPFEALPYYPEWKYIYLVRDGRDVAMSLYNFNAGYAFPEWAEKLEDTFVEFWDSWLETGRHLWPLWDHIDSWWKIRHLPNVLLVHYTNLTKNKANEVERIAEFLEVEMDAEKKALVLQQSSLEYMKENWEKFQPPGFIPQGFFGKGKNGLWKELLPPEKIEKYEKFIIEKLGSECANWVKNGGSLPPILEKALSEADR